MAGVLTGAGAPTSGLAPDPRLARTETPEGTNRSVGPWPLMQAPATRFRQTPIQPRRRRCKHLRHRCRSVLAPSGNAYYGGSDARLAMGLSTNFGLEAPDRLALSTFRPRRRALGDGAGGDGSSGGSPKPRWLAESRGGPQSRDRLADVAGAGHENARRNRGPPPSPPEQAPAVSRLRSIGPFGQRELCPWDQAPAYRLIHDLRGSWLGFGTVVHRSSTDPPRRDRPRPRTA